MTWPCTCGASSCGAVRPVAVCAAAGATAAAAAAAVGCAAGDAAAGVLGRGAPVIVWCRATGRGGCAVCVCRGWGAPVVVWCKAPGMGGWVGTATPAARCVGLGGLPWEGRTKSAAWRMAWGGVGGGVSEGGVFEHVSMKQGEGREGKGDVPCRRKGGRQNETARACYIHKTSARILHSPPLPLPLSAPISLQTPATPSRSEHQLGPAPPSAPPRCAASAPTARHAGCCSDPPSCPATARC